MTSFLFLLFRTNLLAAGLYPVPVTVTVACI